MMMRTLVLFIGLFLVCSAQESDVQLTTNEMTFLPSSFADLELSTSSTLIAEDWQNVNESSRRDPFRSTLFWRFVVENGSYILSSQPRCLRQMCAVKLKYNRTISSTRSRGCLSFALQMRGQPGKPFLSLSFSLLIVDSSRTVVDCRKRRTGEHLSEYSLHESKSSHRTFASSECEERKCPHRMRRVILSLSRV